MNEPKRVDWAQITPHVPRQWSKVGRPHPIPTGALFIVAQPTGFGTTLHAILQYHTGTDTVLGFEPDGKRQAQYHSNAAARQAIEQWAQVINAAPAPDDPMVSAAYLGDHDDEPVDEVDRG